MDSRTLGSLIHYVYTGELAESWEKYAWEDLDIQDMAKAANMYNLPDWMVLCCSALKEEEEEVVVVSGEKLVQMIIAGSRFQHSVVKQLMVVARKKIRQSNKITKDLGFRERLRNCPF